ncbi:hypothetical protein CYMTET_55441 [Cymbomonas tetramitiformis]|uniref:Uncharacterized protein n=1 Tax=Cymbomonas tetramitiformis TaxID=36881 RepID=A0AAE0BE70_9CHLO|nr:hypothetical protein CYMTET_55441 [Cymbomonas tetramitiformis]
MKVGKRARPFVLQKMFESKEGRFSGAECHASVLFTRMGGLGLPLEPPPPADKNTSPDDAAASLGPTDGQETKILTPLATIGERPLFIRAWTTPSIAGGVAAPPP